LIASRYCPTPAIARTNQASSGANIIQLVHRVHALTIAKGIDRVARANISPAPSSAATTDVAVVIGSRPRSSVTHRPNSGHPMNSATAMRRLSSSSASRAAAIVTIAPVGGVIDSIARVRTTATDRLKAALITVAVHGLIVNRARASARNATAASVICRCSLSSRPATTPSAAARTNGARNHPSADQARRPEARPNPIPAAMSTAQTTSQYGLSGWAHSSDTRPSAGAASARMTASANDTTASA